MTIKKLLSRSRSLESFQRYAQYGQPRRVKFSTTVSPETLAWFESIWRHDRLNRGRVIDALVAMAQQGE